MKRLLTVFEVKQGKPTVVISNLSYSSNYLHFINHQHSVIIVFFQMIHFVNYCIFSNDFFPLMIFEVISFLYHINSTLFCWR